MNNRILCSLFTRVTLFQDGDRHNEILTNSSSNSRPS